jgi:bacillithiol synthase
MLRNAPEPRLRPSLWASGAAVYHELSMVAIPYEEAPHTTRLFSDYVHDFERIRRFYGQSPFEFEGFQEVARQIEVRYKDRPALAEILTQQNQAFGCSEPTFASIRRLTDSSVFAVVTGQQVGLFSGPAFTLYKALTAVRLAESLAEKGLTCVPVFWLATEDHDLDEVASTVVLDETGAIVLLSDAGIRAAPQSSVGRVRLSPEVTRTIDRLEEVFPACEERDVLIRDLRQCYAPGVAWGRAFGSLMAKFFSRFGVVLVDPLDERLHHLARPAYERALRTSGDLRELLQNRSKNLIDSGYHAQVHTSDDSTLLFASPEGSRLALRQRDGSFYLEGGHARSATEMEQWIAARPQDFSPSALLRPVIQDTLLPTVAYVAGPAELAYFGQAQALYSEFGRAMPVLFPRAGFTLAEHKIARLLEKYHITLQDIWKGEEHLRRQIAAAAATDGSAALEQQPAGGNSVELGSPGGSGSIEAPGGGAWARRLASAEEVLKNLLAGLHADVKSIDPTLADAVRNSQEKMVYQLDRLKGKISRAAVQRSELLRRHEHDLLSFLMPAGKLQEREISGIYFLARAGYSLLDRLLREIPVNRAEHHLFVY